MGWCECEQGDAAAVITPVVLDTLPCMGFFVRGCRVEAQNAAALEQSGLEEGALCGLEDLFLGAFPELSARAGVQRFECVMVRQGGRLLPVQGAARWLGGDAWLVVAMERPVDDTAGEGTFLGDMLDSSPEAMAITNAGRVLHVNQEFTRAVWTCAGGLRGARPGLVVDAGGAAI